MFVRMRELSASAGRHRARAGPRDCLAMAVPMPDLPVFPPRVPCYGPRDRLLSENPLDELRFSHLGKTYLVPSAGSHRELGLEQTWATADGRYGPTTCFARNESRKQSLQRAVSALGGTVQHKDGESQHHPRPSPRPGVRSRSQTSMQSVPYHRCPSPDNDDFSWGVGEDAELVVPSLCADVTYSRCTPEFWIRSFANGRRTPRWSCPQGMTRASRSLLLAAHQGQLERGLAVPSEAMIPSWAL
ncbi:hypothetical protein ED733_003984 [Metarhizium rileyi]|uniref:Uncharacterized protein n=1 Tax=Metarhizium rileyi (strain RCEF 4871) TaxID=1649241 RepID=A0A5C6G544_METRR|nr:hypothetical protein ED733_003984 [Metarhizium rileyi]